MICAGAAGGPSPRRRYFPGRGSAPRPFADLSVGIEDAAGTTESAAGADRRSPGRGLERTAALFRATPVEPGSEAPAAEGRVMIDRRLRVAEHRDRDRVADVDEVCRRIPPWATAPHTIRGELRTVIGAVGDDRGKERLRALESLECVESVTPILQPFKLASREVRRESTTQVDVGGRRRSAAGRSWSWPDRARSSRASQVLEVAERVKAAGAARAARRRLQAAHLAVRVPGARGRGAKLLAEARRETGLPVVTEVMEPDKVELVAEHADILQIGARNVQNFSLLRRVAETRKPVLLKRGMSTTIQEWLLSAEYVLARRQPQRHPVRARHPHLRDGHALHAGPQRRAGAQEAHAPARRGRSEPRDRALGVRRGRWRWPRWPSGADGLIIEVHPQPGGGPVGRPAVAQARALRRADGAGADGSPRPSIAIL